MHRSKPDARVANVTLTVMTGLVTILTLAGTRRLAPYLGAVAGDLAKATDLYLWASELAGALHSTIAHVEIGVRNAISRKLSSWNSAQGVPYGPDWALQGMTAPLLYGVIGEKAITFARSRANEEASRRSAKHPRHRAPVTNDDVIAQLMFGSWVKIVAPISGAADRQKQLWADGLDQAFPGAAAGDAGRKRLGSQLERVRRLRNRVAHHDNLLDVQVDHRLNDVLAILRAVDPALPALAMARSRIRTVLHADPRRPSRM